MSVMWLSNLELLVNAEGEPIQKMDFLTEEEYLNVLESLPQENQYLEDSDPNKVYC